MEVKLSVSQTDMTSKQKTKIDNEIISILKFQCDVLGIDWLKMPVVYRDLAIGMFVEGVRFWKEKI